jgi:hypothetical protein
MKQNIFGTTRPQGCQMVCFQTQNPNLGKFWRVLLWQIFGILYDHLVYFTAIGNILWPFGILDREKSGNLARPEAKPVRGVQN